MCVYIYTNSNLINFIVNYVQWKKVFENLGMLFIDL